MSRAYSLATNLATQKAFLSAPLQQGCSLLVPVCRQIHFNERFADSLNLVSVTCLFSSIKTIGFNNVVIRMNFLKGYTLISEKKCLKSWS